MKKEKPEKKHRINYDKWGYIFIAPFFITYFVFALIPLLMTFYYSFFERYNVGLQQIGPKFVFLDNYIKLFSSGDFFLYLWNTLLMWVLGFVPQIVVALLLALLFTSLRLKIKGQRFFKTVIYMPNLIMASAFSMLFFALFSDSGPINGILMGMGIVDTPFRFLSSIGWTRGLVATMNFLMWFGNTTILLMAGIMGIDQALFEAAEMDGAKSNQIFFKVTLPLLTPILVYVVITAMIGGIQMFDVPQILTNGSGAPDRSTMTLIMFLNKHLFSRNYGMAGALSVIIFILTAILGLFVYHVTMKNYRSDKPKARKKVANGN